MTFDLVKIKSLATDELLQTPLVQYLVEVCQKQFKKIEELESEIRLLKNHPPRPISNQVI